jgi:tetratricopeptide (TPR) repeat protein
LQTGEDMGVLAPGSCPIPTGPRRSPTASLLNCSSIAAICFALALYTVPVRGTTTGSCEHQTGFQELLNRGRNLQVSVSNREQAYEEAIRQCPDAQAAYHGLSVLLLQEGNFSGAFEWIHRGLRAAPHEPNLTLDLGIALLAIGEPEKALIALRPLPPTSKSEFYLGMTYRALRDPNAAQKALAKSFAMGYHNPYVLYVLIEQDRVLHDKAAGLQAFRTLAQQFPDSAWLHLLMGDAYASRHEETQAELEYQKAAALDAKLPVVHFDVGFIAFNRAQYSQALDEFRKEIAVDPAFGEAYLYLGTSLCRIGKDNQALPYLRDAVARDPNNSLAYQQLAAAQTQAGDPQAALKTLLTAERRFPKTAAFPAQLALVLRKLGKSEQAEQQTKVAQTLSGESNTLLGSGSQPLLSGSVKKSAGLERLSVCLKRSNAPCALDALRDMDDRNLQRNPGFLDLEAQAFSLLTKKDQALSAIQRAIQIDPNNAGYFITEGRVYQKAGEQVAAIKCFLRAGRLAPRFPLPLYYLGMSFFLMGNDFNADGYYQRAARHFRAALELDGHYDKAEFMLALIDVLESRFDEAQQDFEEALRMNPDNSYYHLEYGILLDRLGQRSDASRELKDAETLNPADARTYFNLGSVEAKMGKYPEAKAQLETAVSLDPRLMAAYYVLGRVYYRLGLKEKSRQALQSAQRMEEVTGTK